MLDSIVKNWYVSLSFLWRCQFSGKAFRLGDGLLGPALPWSIHLELSLFWFYSTFDLSLLSIFHLGIILSVVIFHLGFSQFQIL